MAEEPMRQRWILATVSMALFCVQIDYFAMNLGLPRMAIDLNSTATDLQWMISSVSVSVLRTPFRLWCRSRDRVG
jgi:hypothetical protein